MRMKGIKVIIFSILLQSLLKPIVRDGNYKAILVVVVGSCLGLRIAKLNPPQVFYWFGFPKLSYCCVIYFPHYF